MLELNYRVLIYLPNGFLGWMSSNYENKDKYLKMLEKIKNFDAKNLTVECFSFEKVFEKYPRDFFYCDP